MNTVAVITDSAASIPQEKLQQLGVRVVPLVIIFGHKIFLDRVDIETPAELFRMIEKEGQLPTSSAPSPTDYLEAYRALSSCSESILNITISSRYSMGFEAASKAKELARSEFGYGNIEVFDSRSTVAGEGLIVLAAAEAAAQGKSLVEVLEVARSVRSRLNYVATLDTLSYLARSGRLGRATAWVGTLLDIKPILEVSAATGFTEPLERVRGRKRALERLLEIMKERLDSRGPVRVMVDHVDAPEAALSLREQVAASFNCSQVYIAQYSPVASMIVGPQVVGLGCYSEEEASLPVLNTTSE